MPRKFRLSTHRKNEFRKKRASKASIEHTPVAQVAFVQTDASCVPTAPESLVVSLPLNVLMEADASTLDALQQRVLTLLTLPKGTISQIVNGQLILFVSGWCNISTDHQCICYSRVQVNDDVMQVIM